MDNKPWLYWWAPMPEVSKYLDHINSFTSVTHDHEVSPPLAICQWALASSSETECGKQRWTEAMGCENRGLERSWGSAEAEETQLAHSVPGSQCSMGSISFSRGQEKESLMCRLCWPVFISQVQEFKSLLSYFLVACLTQQCFINTSVCLRCYCLEISLVMPLWGFSSN